MRETFRWNDWNVDHIAEHGVTPEEAEIVVLRSRSDEVQFAGDGKYLVWGRGRGGRFLQVIFVRDEDEVCYVIHARPLTTKEKRRFRRKS